MKGYTIQREDWLDVRSYKLLNPFGHIIAEGLSWRTARKIADALNAQRGQ